jgi:carboxypeptidase Taq
MPYPTKTAEALTSLRRRFSQIADLSQIGGLLSWDRHTYLPPAAGESRGRQSATLDTLSHEKLTDPRVGEWLERLEDAELQPEDAALVRLCRRKYDRAVRLPAELVEEMADARSQAQDAWLEARRQNAFGLFAPHLARMFELCREQADRLGYEGHRYDALHDEYEPGSSAARISRLFAELRPPLVELVHSLAASGQDDRDAVLHGEFDELRQEEFVRDEVTRFGFDFRRGRLDPTVHPFAQGIDRSDVRITTRYRRDFLPTGLFATFHEAGHGMYEQGLNPRLARSPLGDAISLGVHESQSRMWENLVGRSLRYWRGAYPRLQALFPESLGDVPLADFYRAINCVKPSYIRVEADEVTYNLHVIARFELELALLDGDLEAAGLPEAWNSKYGELLGIESPDDVLGCLQDVHWSLGLIGYFPTYTLGNLMSVQLFEAACQHIPRLEEKIEAGEHAPLLDWLKRNVHERGSLHQPDELLELATGSVLDAGPYLRYLGRKFQGLYQRVGSA